MCSPAGSITGNPSRVMGVSGSCRTRLLTSTVTTGSSMPRRRKQRRLPKKKRAAMTLPIVPMNSVESAIYAHATSRWRDSGYDDRLFPYVYPNEATQRCYDLYDAWVNTGYEPSSEYWPPRTLEGVEKPGVDAHGRPAVCLRGAQGYVPTTRQAAWGVGGVLDEELAEHGTLGFRHVPRVARPGSPRPER